MADPLFYLLGYYYGDAAVRWLERKSPSYGPIAREAERLFGRYGYPLVFFAPNAYICLFAGAARMPVGCLPRREHGGHGRSPLPHPPGRRDVRVAARRRARLLPRLPLPLLVASVAIVAFTIWNERRQGKGSLDSVTPLPDDLDDLDKP